MDQCEKRGQWRVAVDLWDQMPQRSLQRSVVSLGSTVSAMERALGQGNLGSARLMTFHRYTSHFCIVDSDRHLTPMSMVGPYPTSICPPTNTQMIWKEQLQAHMVT